MKVLVACEFSGAVRRELKKRGHYAWSCDLLPAEDGSSCHYKGDVFYLLKHTVGWDMMIAFPPCTHICVSGNRWYAGTTQRLDAMKFVLQLAQADVPKIAIENPIGCLSSYWRKPDQIVQPWQFGHGETKATCLWLKGLPKLRPTRVVKGREQRIWRMPPSDDRSMERSRTYQGIARAMAQQWG